MIANQFLKPASSEQPMWVFPVVVFIAACVVWPIARAVLHLIVSLGWAVTKNLR